MKTSTHRILTTHVGSLPRPESIRALLRARASGQPIDEAQLAARVTEAVTARARDPAVEEAVDRLLRDAELAGLVRDRGALDADEPVPLLRPRGREDAHIGHAQRPRQTVVHHDSPREAVPRSSHRDAPS